MVELTEAEKAEQRRVTYAAADERQAMARRRVNALVGISILPGDPDKRAIRDLRARLESGKPFTPRQLDVTAFMAWRYRRQIDASLVPNVWVSKP